MEKNLGLCNSKYLVNEVIVAGKAMKVTITVLNGNLVGAIYGDRLLFKFTWTKGDEYPVVTNNLSPKLAKAFILERMAQANK